MLLLRVYNQFNMKNYIHTLLLIFISINAFGQSPNWVVNENNFQYTMSFEGFVTVDGRDLSSPNDKVAAFVNGECRGVASLLYVASEKKYFVYLTVFSNTENENISFKIYDSVSNSIKNVENSKVFENNKHFGNLFQAFSFASPTLNNEADIVDFGFKDLKISNKTIVGSNITIFVDNVVNISTLNSLFELSTGAQLYLENTIQIPGSNSIDFSKPVVFQVLSENRSVLKKWIVYLKVGAAKFYKKDVVCYAGGEIKVVYPENNAETILSKDGAIIDRKSIINGETFFNNLISGTYQIEIAGLNKEIIIKQKK